MIFLLFFLPAFSAAVFYIVPDSGPSLNQACVVNNTKLRPCFTFSQLDIMPKESSMTLIFLPGTHVISRNSSMVASNMSSLDLSPFNTWNEKHDVEIECQAPSFMLLFENIYDLTISDIKFTSCTLQFVLSPFRLYDDHTVSTLNITGSLFLKDEPDPLDYRIVVEHYHYDQGRVYIERCTFHSNSGAVRSIESYLVIRDTYFFENYVGANGNGSALFLSDTELILVGCQFSGNIATLGGAIFALCSYNVQVINTAFRNNSARLSGGAIYSFDSSLILIDAKFEENSAQLSGGAVYYNLSVDSSNNFASINSVFKSNHAGMFGGALFCIQQNHYLDYRHHVVDCEASRNSATNGGFAYMSKCTILVSGLQAIENSATKGGVVYAEESMLSIGPEHPNNISYNRAEIQGGALFLRESQIVMTESARALLHYNKVTSVNGKGGAIFVLDGNCEFVTYPKNKCFIEYYSHAKPILLFANNEAKHGPILYGGLLDRCLPSNQFATVPNPSPLIVFKNISYFEPAPMAITSAPLKTCLCFNSHPDCSVSEITTTKMRGEGVELTLVAVDQDGNSVPSIITAGYREALSVQLRQGESNQQVPGKCSHLSYHVYSSASTNEATLVIRPSENPCGQSVLSILSVRVKIAPCSRGFEQQENTCICDRRLTENFNVTVCDVDTQSIQKSGSIWLRYDEEHLLILSNCPLDYCQVTYSNISISSPDDQCADNHSGIICGGCQGNYSIALGGSGCLDCTSSYNFIWLTLVFAMAGLALVAFLLVCNITISTGTLNGLIFYANVVSTSGLTSLNNCSVFPVLSVFIAWVNLDFGVETCFYSGMDTYQKTWLQFVFPLYIWLLVGAIIVASYYSSTAMKLFGRNNIALLATLFLLSYSKLLKTIITALSFTQVWRAVADNVSDQLVPYKVWIYDGNIEYLKGQHIALFVVAFLVLVLLFLPYTLLLLFGQCVRSMPVRRKKGLQWIRSTAFISILDAYHAPYHKKHRYWTGLMLLTRCVLFLVFATNPSENAVLANTFTVTLLIIAIFVIKTRLTKVYRVVSVDILETCFLLNLVVLSATLYYLIGSGSSNGVLCRTITASIAVSFIMFLGILAYHAHLQISKTKCYASIKQRFLLGFKEKSHSTILGGAINMKNVDLSSKLPTNSNVELREALLESTQ